MKFKLYWLTGDEEVVEGNDIADAFSKAGYGTGAMGALDYFQPMTIKIIMCVGTWPENNYADFEVTKVREGETEESAIVRAKLNYGEDQEYYVKEIDLTL